MIIAVPGDTPVTIPVEETEAMPGSELAHVIDGPVVARDPSELDTTAFSWTAAPGPRKGVNA